MLTNDSNSIRILVLILACLLLFGNYYCYDIPGALNVQLREWLDVDYDQWQFQMNFLYTTYSLPNLFMPIVGGILVDRVGPTRMLMIFVCIVCVGQILFTWGVSVKTYWLMILGRILFGIGGESLEVAQARITTDWFRHHSLGLALGLNLTCARLASALNDIISPLVSENTNNSPVASSALGFILCVFSGVCGVLLVLINRRQSRQSQEYTSLLTSSSNSSDTEDNTLSVPSEHNSREKTLETADEHVKWTDIRQLPASFWILCLATVALYGAVNPFIHILSDFLQTKYNFNSQEAGTLMALPDIISAVGSPLGGFAIDQLSKRRNGHMVRAVFLPISGILLMCVHLMMGFTSIPPVYALSVLGISYSIFGAALWPLVPQLVTNHALLGTAYGVSAVGLNISLTVVPMIVSQILSYGSYQYVQIWFVSLSIVGIMLSIAVGVIEYKRGQDLYDYTPISENVNNDIDSSDSECEVEIMGDHHFGYLPPRRRYESWNQKPGSPRRKLRRHRSVDHNEKGPILTAVK